MNFENIIPGNCTAFGCTNRRSTTSLQFYRISSAKRYPVRRMKWSTAMRRDSARIRSAYFATGKSPKPSKA